ncbi:MAG: hypothetical protein OXF78_11715 [Rhodospirillales bacterium]|nr:hypothetical protein [Rhodospirillales bacterium]
MDIDENQIRSLLHRPSEGLQVEVKNWLDPRTDENVASIIKAIFAIRNRNGGFLVIGFDNDTLLPDKYDLDESAESLYHIDDIQRIVSRYATASFEVGVALGDRDGQVHPVIVVPEGVRVPVIVKRDLILNGGKKLLRAGDIYFRTLQSNGTPSSARILPADFPELLEVCFENREADIGRFLRRHLPGVDGRAVEALLGTGGADPTKRLRERSFTLIEEATEAFQVAVAQHDQGAEFNEVKEALTMRVGLVLDPAKSDELPTREFMNKVSASNPEYTGWPAWLDSRSFAREADRAHVTDGAWQSLIINLDGGWSPHFEFLRFDPTGEFYLQRVMQDDLTRKVPPGTAMDVVLMIYRVAEVLAVGVSMARSLNWDPNDRAGFAFKWTGLTDRQLLTWANQMRGVGMSSGQSRSAAAESFVEVPIETPHSALAPHVAVAVGPLFAAFDGYTPSPELIETSVRRMIERKM